MARKESRTHVRIWSDRDFTSLSGRAQRTYWMVFSQPNINLCGVIALTVGRWAQLAADTSVEDIWAALGELETAGLVIIDRDTEELLVRSFVRWDGGWFSSKTRGVAIAQRDQVLSGQIADALEIEFERAEQERFERENPKPQADGVSTDTEIGVSDRAIVRGADTPRADAHAVSSLLSPSPVSNHRSPSPSANGSAADIVEAALWIVAQKKLKERQGSSIVDTQKWLKKVLDDDVRPKLQERARQIVEGQPDISPDTLAWDLQRPERSANGVVNMAGRLPAP